MMNTAPKTPAPAHGHAAAIQALFPGGVAALDTVTTRSLIDQYLAAEKNPEASGSPFMLRNMSAEPLGYEVLPGGVAVIRWDGAMQQRPHPIVKAILGYVDTSEISSAVQTAAADPLVRSIMMVVDSPGGALPGIAELSAVVADVARTKPVVALTDGLLASAAYWAVSGASAIYGTGPTVNVGSIGVVLVHSYAPRSDGSVVTEISAGKFKRVGSGARPLTTADLDHLQERVDYLTQQFVNAVATNRRLSASAVAAQEGRTYIGQQAVDAKLLDGFMSESKLQSQLAADPGRFLRRTGTAPAAPARSNASAPAAPVTATTWPPKLIPVVSAPVTPASMLEATGQAEEDLRAEAAELVRMHKLTTARWPKVMTWKAWEQAGAARARQDGCTVVEALRREGWVHPYVSLPTAPKLGTPGAKPRIELNKRQMAERGAALAAFKNIGVLEAFKYLGFKG